MLFDSEIKRCCTYCESSVDLDGDLVLCKFKGPVSFDFCCQKYKYDALRRAPNAAARPQKVFTKEDFEL